MNMMQKMRARSAMRKATRAVGYAALAVGLVLNAELTLSIVFSLAFLGWSLWMIDQFVGSLFFRENSWLFPRAEPASKVA